ncbi:MAG TPA: cupin domain-containing protein [Burkholderiales bacterium]|jgi:quercetin dioxygenase-like cupin family protein|nr:cupin domain-containing protein [Burkholderiales bacterium]
MKRFTWIAAFALAFGVALEAQALEETPAVKVTPLVKSTTSWNGKRVAYPRGEAEITGMVIEIAPGAETGWHAHPVPSFGMVLQGTLEVSLKDGRRKRIGAGEGLIEVVDTLHNGRNVGTEPVKIVVFYAGAVGMPLTVKP